MAECRVSFVSKVMGGTMRKVVRLPIIALLGYLGYLIVGVPLISHFKTPDDVRIIRALGLGESVNDAASVSEAQLIERLLFLVPEGSTVDQANELFRKMGFDACGWKTSIGCMALWKGTWSKGRIIILDGELEQNKIKHRHVVVVSGMEAHNLS